MPKRKLTPIAGKGAHSKPKLVSGGRFHGKVLKKADGTISLEQARKRRDKSMRFQKALVDAGIPIIPAEAKIAGQGNERRLYFVQGKVKSKNILANVFPTASIQDCLRLTREMLSHAEKMNAYSKNTNNLAVLDINFHNWVLQGNSLACIDFYPGIIKPKGKIEIYGLGTTQSKIVKAGKIALYPLQERKRRNPTLRTRAIIDRAIQFRPEFTEQFLELGRKHAKTHYSGKTLEKLLKAMEKPETLKVGPSKLGKLAMKLNERAERKQ